MLVFGPPSCIPYIENKYAIFNYNVCIMKYPSIGLLPTTIPIDQYTEYQFDISYANYLMSDQVFYNFFNLIIRLQEGQDVYLVSDTNNDKSIINSYESLLKFIQQRYGYNGNVIHEPEDLYYVKESTFTVQGLYQFDVDRLRYYEMISSK